ncbi:MAG: RdgB/HAM1 family non-canonical purine NTP pyrophosphatase [Alphaproteobacteria bacterium]|nr:RdgB/HAM1 family non-canonical purine NTP pyrophosphatase [Alphaproteobacteria bacterium]
MRRFEGSQLVIATHNAGKFKEFTALLGARVKDIKSATDFNLPEPEETGTSYTENAILKARAAATATGLPALADDSGLSVKALGGKPGIHSARYAETPTGKDYAQAMQRLYNELGDAQNRSASFVCVLALAWPDGHVETVEGTVEGHISWPPRGGKGHGYDPIFVIRGENRTFAEMKADEKDDISHRGIAVRKLIEQAFS